MQFKSVDWFHRVTGYDKLSEEFDNSSVILSPYSRYTLYIVERSFNSDAKVEPELMHTLTGEILKVAM